MKTISYNDLFAQIRDVIIDRCVNVRVNGSTKPEYSNRPDNFKCNKIELGKKTKKDKTYVTFEVNNLAIKEIATMNAINSIVVQDELSAFLSENGMSFSNPNDRLGTRDVLNILAAASTFYTRHLRYVSAPIPSFE